MPDLDKATLAADYGWSLALLRSDKSLSALFDAAVKNNYTAEKFTAELRNTAWYKKNGESARQYQVLKNTDPATMTQRRAQMRAQLADAAAQMGASIPSVKLNAIAEQALMLNWNDSQLRNAMGGYVHAVNGVYNGSAATDTDALKQTAWRNGVNISAATMQSWAQQIAMGNANVAFYKDYIKKSAKSLAPAYADELDAGMDLFDIAQPLMEAKAKILEMNPADIDLNDKDIRNALSSVGPDGKAASQSLWQFEQQMRKNPAWLKTQNAQDSIMSVGKKVLSDMGLGAF